MGATGKKLGDLFVHEGVVRDGTIAVGDVVDCAVDHARRGAIRANHSATHLLHEALRLTLGDHVAQKGSLVAPDRLRFDFAHQKPISPEELARIEDLANQAILDNTPVTTRLMASDEGDEVRRPRPVRREVRRRGSRRLHGGIASRRTVPATPIPQGPAFSVELCGGTHVARTGDIGLVTIVSDGAVAAGVRRVEAKTGAAASPPPERQGGGAG